MSNKTAQHTKLDEALIGREPGRYRGDKEKPILPFDDWSVRNQLEDSTTEQRQKQQKPTEPFKLKYPELTPEMVRYRGLNEKELERIDKEEKHDREYYERYRNYRPYESRYERYYELNKALPEEAKKRVLDKYEQLKRTGAEFQAKYNEANELASRNIELDYSGSYIDLFRNFGRFIVGNIHKYLGVLFGILPEGSRRSYSYSNKASNLAEFINNGINLFNITPLNIDTKIHEMASAIHSMNAIMNEYERRKKVLKKIPKIDVDIKRYLLKRDNRAFLKWMDEYFPNDKKEFMESTIRNIMDTHSLSDHNFQLGQLKNVKIYSDAYRKSVSTATHSLMYSMERQVQSEIKSRLTEEFVKRIKPKIIEFADIVKKTLDEGYIDELIKYINKNFKLDLRSIFNFVQASMRKSYAFNAEENEKLEKGWLDNHVQEKYYLFLGGFKEDLESSMTELKKRVLANDTRFLNDNVESVINNYINKYFPKGEVKHQELSNLSSKDFDELINDFFKYIIIAKLPNFKRSGYGYGYALPGFDGVGELLKETGKFNVESIVNYTHKLVPFVPKEFIVHLVKTLFRGQIPDSDTITSLDSAYKSLTYLAGTTPATAMKVFLNLLKKTGKFSPDNFTNEYIRYFQAIDNMVGKFIAEFNPAVSGRSDKKFTSEDDVIRMFSLILKNFDTVNRDRQNFNSIMDFMHNSAGNLSEKDVVKLFSNNNFVAYSKIGIVKKMFNTYAQIRNLGGIKGIYEKYGKYIEEMKQDGFVSKNFDANIRFIVKVFNSGEDVNPAKPFFKRLFIATSAMESDLEAIEMGDALKEMIKEYQPKDKRLFKLDVQVNNRLRFRVLKDKDPRMLRVGIESDCCQRIGGVGEAAAKDSFVNPLAGVVILEWKNDEGEWVMLTQSYFHYVPRENAYILDNVESNRENVSESGVDLSAMYAYLAQVMKERYQVGYFLAGKSYSKIGTKDFKTNKLRGGDPRTFVGGKYTDFTPSDNMDLTKPNFDLDKRISGYLQEGQNIREAFEINLPRLIKFALVA